MAGGIKPRAKQTEEQKNAAALLERLIEVYEKDDDFRDRLVAQVRKTYTEDLEGLRGKKESEYLVDKALRLLAAFSLSVTTHEPEKDYMEMPEHELAESVIGMAENVDMLLQRNSQMRWMH